VKQHAHMQHYIIQCCNNSHQEAPHTGKQMIRSHTELQCWPVQCHTVYTKYACGMENCNW